MNNHKLITKILLQKASYLALLQEFPEYGIEANRSSFDEFYSEYKKNEIEPFLSRDEVEAEVRSFIMKCLIPDNHKIIMVDKTSYPVSEILYKFIDKSKDIDESQNLELRLYSYFDNNANDWYTDWILTDKADSLKGYNVSYNIDYTFSRDLVETFGIDWVMPEYDTTLNIFKPQASLLKYNFLATCKEEALALFLVKYFNDNTLVNGIKSIETIFNKYAYSIDFDALEFEEIDTEDINKDEKDWSLIHLGFYNGNCMIEPTSLWLGTGPVDSSWIVREAYDWYKMTDEDENSLFGNLSYYECTEIDFNNKGLIRFENIFPTGKAGHYLDSYEGLIVFKHNLSSLLKSGTLKSYRQGRIYLNTFNEMDARIKFEAYHTCKVYGLNPSNMNLEEKSKMFKCLTTEKIVEVTPAEIDDLTCIEPNKDYFENQSMSVKSVKKKPSNIIDGTILIKRHTFSIMSKNYGYIIETTDGTNISMGTNKTSAYIHLTGKNIVYNDFVYVVSPYVSHYGSSFCINYDSLVHYTLFFSENKG